MDNKEKIQKIASALADLMRRMFAIRQKQLLLFDKIDKIVSGERVNEIRKKINK